VLEEALDLAPNDVIILLVDTESKLMELNSMDLGGRRSLTTAESMLQCELCRPRFGAQAAMVVSLEKVPEDLAACGKLSVLAKDATATRYANNTPPSITKYLRSLAIDKRPGLIHPGSLDYPLGVNARLGGHVSSAEPRAASPWTRHTN
jgi:hypothetical protein